MKKTLLVLAGIFVVIIICNGCAVDRRWYSTYKDKKSGDNTTEHYNGYKRKWYRKNWNNRNIWK